MIYSAAYVSPVGKTLCTTATKSLLSSILQVMRNISPGIIVPIIETSNVTGQNIELLKDFLNLLPKRRDYSGLVNLPMKYIIQETFTVKGTGTVVSGFLAQGTVRIGDKDQKFLIG